MFSGSCRRPLWKDCLTPIHGLTTTALSSSLAAAFFFFLRKVYIGSFYVALGGLELTVDQAELELTEIHLLLVFQVLRLKVCAKQYSEEARWQGISREKFLYGWRLSENYWSLGENKVLCGGKALKDEWEVILPGRQGSELGWSSGSQWKTLEQVRKQL